MLGQDNLFEPPGLIEKKKATVPGMASWGGEGPAGATCRECSHWQFEKRGGWYSASHALSRALKPQRCGLAVRRLMRDDLPKIEHAQPSCKHFEKNADAPSITKPD